MKANYILQDNENHSGFTAVIVVRDVETGMTVFAGSYCKPVLPKGDFVIIAEIVQDDEDFTQWIKGKGFKLVDESDV